MFIAGYPRERRRSGSGVPDDLSVVRVPQGVDIVREWRRAPTLYSSSSLVARRNASTARLCSGSVRENAWDPSFFDTK